VQESSDRTPAADDVLDVGDLFRRLRRRSGWIAAGALAGGVLAATAAAYMPPVYQSTAKVLIRDQQGGGLPRLDGSPLEMLFKSARSGIATEVEILTSRPVLEEVVDSLALQWQVVRPRGTDAGALFSQVQVRHDTGKPVRYRFARRGDEFVVEGAGGRWTARPGQPLDLPHGQVTLRPGTDVDRIDVRLESRRAAVARTDRALASKETTSDLLTLTYKAGDPQMAEAVPAFLISRYLAQRTHTDRNVNRRQLAFLERHEDSLRVELSAAEAAFRDHQERSGTFDAATVGEQTLERALELRASADAVEVELRALNALLASGAASASTSELAAYPTFLTNPAINGVLNRILELRSQRTELLDRRTEADDDVQVVTANLRAYEAELQALSSAYRDGLLKQQREFAQSLAPYQAVLAALPENMLSQFRLEREVRRLAETLLLIQAQLVQVRLTVVGEGGEVRAVEPAQAPEKPTWPKPLLFLLLGVAGGAFLGTAGAVVRGYTDPVIRSEADARAATGLAATGFPAGEPLLVGGMNGARSILLVPAGRASAAVTAAEAILAGARMQGVDASMLDATHPAGDGGATAGRLASLEASHPLVVAALPGLARQDSLPLLNGSRKVLLVAEAGWTRADALRRAASLLSRIDVAPAGVVVLQEPARERLRLRVFRGGSAAHAGAA
jgi:uncharacterized protein involved in exopolysaccharide biosynthesis